MIYHYRYKRKTSNSKFQTWSFKSKTPRLYRLWIRLTNYGRNKLLINRSLLKVRRNIPNKSEKEKEDSSQPNAGTLLRSTTQKVFAVTVTIKWIKGKCFRSAFIMKRPYFRRVYAGVVTWSSTSYQKRRVIPRYKYLPENNTL